MIALLWALACGTPVEHSTRSAPVPATVATATPEAEEPVFVDLEGLLLTGPVQLPAPFLDLEFGATAQRIRLANNVLVDPDRPRMDTEISGHLVIGGTPDGYDEVRHSFIFDGDTFSALDLSMPAAAAMQVLEAAWGPPASTGVDAEGRPTAVWTGPTVQVSLLEIEDRAIAKFTPREP